MSAATPPRERILVSACLLGAPVRYHGRAAACEAELLQRWQAEGRLVAFCPEVAGGLPTPRPPAEIEPGQPGRAVLRGLARVLDREGADVTAAFLAGAQQALALARAQGLRLAVLKEDSPSCGSARVYDGHFAGRRQPGAGVAAALLREAGLQVFSEWELTAAARALALLDAEHG